MKDNVKNIRKLSLDRPVTYEIEVPGVLEPKWTDRYVEMRVTVDYDDEGRPQSTLTGTFDQAALQGLLRRLYSLGIPLISINCVDAD